jgi:hypothetical protein
MKIRFKFGDMTFPSIGMITFNLPTPLGVICTNAHIVQADVPLLLGLDVLDKYKLVVNNDDYVMTSSKEEAIHPTAKYCGQKELRESMAIYTFLPHLQSTCRVRSLSVCTSSLFILQ